MASNPKIGENGKKTKREERQLIDKVPIAEVNCENLDALWPQLMESIQNAHLVGIDLVILKYELYSRKYGPNNAGIASILTI